MRLIIRLERRRRGRRQPGCGRRTGTRIAFTVNYGYSGGELYVANADGTARRLLAHDGWDDIDPRQVTGRPPSRRRRCQPRSSTALHDIRLVDLHDGLRRHRRSSPPHGSCDGRRGRRTAGGSCSRPATRQLAALVDGQRARRRRRRDRTDRERRRARLASGALGGFDADSATALFPTPPAPPLFPTNPPPERRCPARRPTPPCRRSRPAPRRPRRRRRARPAHDPDGDVPPTVAPTPPQCAAAYSWRSR
ncbi:MAG: hypothetical protein U0470_02955 [Anaerolineae bacterium]